MKRMILAAAVAVGTAGTLSAHDLTSTINDPDNSAWIFVRAEAPVICRQELVTPVIRVHCANGRPQMEIRGTCFRDVPLKITVFSVAEDMNDPAEIVLGVTAIGVMRNIQTIGVHENGSSIDLKSLFAGTHMTVEQESEDGRTLSIFDITELPFAAYSHRFACGM